MKKIKYCGPEDHVVVFVEHGAMKFRKNEIKEVSDVFVPKLLAFNGGKFELVEEPKPIVQAEAKVLPVRARNRQMPKAEVKDGSEL